MTSTGERTTPSTREVPLTPGGRVEVVTTSAELWVRGIDEDVVRVTVDEGDVDAAVRIDGGPDHVRVHDVERGTFQFGPLTVRALRGVDLQVEVPRRAALSVRTISGDVEATGLAGETRWATTSGGLRLVLDGGPVRVESMSGDVDLRAGVGIALGIRSVSGDLRVRAPRLLGLLAESTSGDVHVEAALARAGSHAISTVSGDVELATGSPVRVETQTVTGDVESALPHHTEGSRGRRTIVIGEDGAAVRVRTMSGDIELRGGPSAEGAEEPADAAGAQPPAFDAPAPWAPPAPPIAPVAPEPPTVVAEATAAPNLVRPAAPLPPLAGGGTIDRREAARLEILRALERGELDVESAAHRLETIDEAGPLGFRGLV